MPTYNVSECLTNINYLVSAGTLSIGTVIGFNAFEDNKCGIVGDESSDAHNAIFVQTFESCCECLSAVTDSLNFRFVGCDDSIIYNIEATNFCNSFGIPLTGRTYSIQLGSDTPFCAEFQELSPTGQTNYFYVGGPYTSCSNCGNVPVRTTYSAGTFVSYLCRECSSGGTISSSIATNTPHPSYTNSNGDEVIQLQMVTLGGPTGLNN